MTADMTPVYLVTFWIMGILVGFMIGRHYTLKKVLKMLDDK